MTKPAISVRGLGKQYRIGARQERYQTLRERIAGAFRWKVAELQSDRVAGSSARQVGSGGANPEPRTKNPEPGTNLATQQPNNPTTSRTDLFWALKDVSFNIQPGEVVGVIGRNGAGKSTLLKVLTQITYPTEGEVEIRGRVASLLEVGTGFHPELTGRENIFLNGAILGMKPAEIVKKFDEIVAFAEVDQFLDTPVKRYSSGMYVRLAFAVAAHLEPEILLVDEVLAVGDIQFQQKCLGKMGDVAKSGRTILFVSHNMAAVENLCTRAILLQDGALAYCGQVNDALVRYLDTGMQSQGRVDLRQHPHRPRGYAAALETLEMLDSDGKIVNSIRTGDDLTVIIELAAMPRVRHASVAITISDHMASVVVKCWTHQQWGGVLALDERLRVTCKIADLRLTVGLYRIGLVVHGGKGVLDRIDAAASLNVESADLYGTGRMLAPGRGGVFYPHVQWYASPASISFDNA